MNYFETVKFIDSWGSKEDEFFVVSCNRALETYTLAKTPGGQQVGNGRKASELRYPNGENPGHFHPGDLVRLVP
jgi:hypothetical protein